MGFLTVVVIVMALYSFSLLMIADRVVVDMTESLQERIDLSVYLKTDVGEDKVEMIKADVLASGLVNDVEYVKPDDALKDFENDYEDNEIISQSLEFMGENPFGGTLILRTNKMNTYEDIDKLLNNEKYTSYIEYKDFEDNRNIISTLDDLSTRVNQIGLGMVIIFMMISVIVIFVTIKVTVYSRKNEIEIMRLVGASPWFIRMPFVVESFILGCLAWFVVVISFYPIMLSMRSFFDSFLQGFEIDIIAMLQLDFWRLMISQLLIAVVLTVISSIVSIGRYLKV